MKFIGYLAVARWNIIDLLAMIGVGVAYKHEEYIAIICITLLGAFFSVLFEQLGMK